MAEERTGPRNSWMFSQACRSFKLVSDAHPLSPSNRLSVQIGKKRRDMKSEEERRRLTTVFRH
jgi:hypothetical protein